MATNSANRALRICSAAEYSAAASLARATIVAVGLVDRDHVAEFDDAFLERLQSVAGARQRQHEKKSVMSATATSDWPTPTVSTKITSWPAAS